MCLISEQNQGRVRLAGGLGTVLEPTSCLRLLRRGAEAADSFLVTGPEKMSASYDKIISMSEPAG
jgi:hypothetical protein